MEADEKGYVVITARYDSKCRRCYKPIKKGSKAKWQPKKRTMKHINCDKGEKPIHQLAAGIGKAKFRTGVR